MEIRVSLSDFRANQSELFGKVEFGGEKIVIERFGVPTAALVSMDDLARIYGLEADEIAAAVNARTGVRGALVTVGRILIRLGNCLGDRFGFKRAETLG